MRNFVRFHIQFVFVTTTSIALTCCCSWWNPMWAVYSNGCLCWPFGRWGLKLLWVKKRLKISEEYGEYKKEIIIHVQLRWTHVQISSVTIFIQPLKQMKYIFVEDFYCKWCSCVIFISSFIDIKHIFYFNMIPYKLFTIYDNIL